MSQKGIWIIMASVLLCAVLLMLVPDTAHIPGSTSPEMDLAPYTSDVTIGIIAAVLCIALFFMYITINTRRKR